MGKFLFVLNKTWQLHKVTQSKAKQGRRSFKLHEIQIVIPWDHEKNHWISLERKFLILKMKVWIKLFDSLKPKKKKKKRTSIYVMPTTSVCYAGHIYSHSLESKMLNKAVTTAANVYQMLKMWLVLWYELCYLVSSSQ